MQSVGIHLILDGWRCPPDLLDDPGMVEQALHAAIEAGGATLINCCVHQFSPQGVTGTATLAESHVAIHTWPEYGYFAADLFFCGSGDPYAAIEPIVALLQAGETRTTELKRGFEAMLRPGVLSGV